MAKPVRVLVVDDSSFFRTRICRYLEESAQITIVGEASDGQEAVRLNQSLSPDVITMDVAMPVMDGISAVRHIMQDRPSRILMISALTREGARSTLEALDAGAVDFIPKLGEGDHSPQEFGNHLRERILQIANSSGRSPRNQPSAVSAPSPRRDNRLQRIPELVIIGASTGGPIAVQEVLKSLPGSCPFPILVVLHMPKMFTGTYAERLNNLTGLRVAEAKDKDVLLPGQVLIAPGGMQTRVAKQQGRLLVKVTEEVSQLYKPCVDISFGAAAKEVKGGVLAIVLTGMGNDGAEGAMLLKQMGNQVWAQDKVSSVVYGMPAAVVQNGSADRILALSEIGQQLRGIWRDD